MKTKLAQFIPALLALVVFGLGYFSLWCTGAGQFCYRTWLDSVFLDVINPLYFFSLYFLPIALILIFVPRHLFNSWLKFALWAIPLALLHIFSTQVSSTAWMDFFPYYRDDAARFAGEVFTVASLILIASKAILPKWREAYAKKYGIENADFKVKEQLIVFTSAAGLFAAYIAVRNNFGDFEIALGSFVMAFAIDLYTIYMLFRFVFLLRENRERRMSLWKVASSLLMLAASIAIMLALWFISP